MSEIKGWVDKSDRSLLEATMQDKTKRSRVCTSMCVLVCVGVYVCLFVTCLLLKGNSFEGGVNIFVFYCFLLLLLLLLPPLLLDPF